jgi:sulfite exporter TauE/SafE
MLASITPLGERGRHSHFAVTVTAFALGATTAGALLGAALGALGGLLPGGFSGDARLAGAAVALLIALALDLTRAGAVPGPRRQVDERWLDRYRGWVYGLGYGAQLGLGVLTVVTSAATYVALLAALLTGSIATGALIVGLYGALRGLTPLLATRVRTPAQLVALHGRLERAEPVTARAGALALGAAAIAGLVLGLS